MRGHPRLEPLNTAHVLIFYDHAVGDGVSMCRVFADWLDAATRNVEMTLPMAPLPFVAPLSRLFWSPAVRRFGDLFGAIVAPMLTPSFLVAMVRRCR